MTRRAEPGRAGPRAGPDCAGPGPAVTHSVMDALGRAHPDARCPLVFGTPFQLLVATILSAQCTDETVNRVTPRLFSRYRTPADLLTLTEEELGDLIRECGLHRTKARNILAACRILVDEHRGEVPAEREALERLPGVGRKTAGVVLANAFGVPAIAVDTHVFRVARRLGLADADTPAGVERQLMAAIPPELWLAAHHRLIAHGRRVCTARRPRCSDCPVANFCRSGDKPHTGPEASVAQWLEDEERHL